MARKPKKTATRSADRIANLNEAMLRIAALEWREGERADASAALEMAGTDLGRFEGLPPQVALLEDGRTARLLTPLTFYRPAGEAWPVPVGIEVDGASIPRLLWTLIGGPFEGRYRNASIVHDYYCVTKEHPWQAAHRVFYEAMRASGVGTAKAKVLYYAVYRFGPRWAEARRSRGGPQAALLTDREAQGIVRDAEAIYIHDPGLDEIDVLAETRNADSAATAAMPEGAAAFTASASRATVTLERARHLVVPGGRGTAEDVGTVAGHVAQLPDYVLKRFEEKGIRFLACRDSVTDFEGSLRGVTPRGWEGTGKTWDDVPGAYFHDRKRVVIGTVSTGSGRVVPGKDSGLHGSVDLVVHESLHGYDYIGGHTVLQDPRFVAARTADLRKLGAYERQEGLAGLEETFAESGARFAVERRAMKRQWRGLFDYWSEGPAEMVMEIPMAALAPPAGADAPIGFAEVLPGGELAVELRAEGPGGAIGHAWFTASPDDPFHANVRSRLLADGEEAATLIGGAANKRDRSDTAHARSGQGLKHRGMKMANATHFCACITGEQVFTGADKKSMAGQRAALLRATKWPVGHSITIRFLGGTPQLQKRVKDAAKEWLKHANLKFEYRNSGPTDIRIAFVQGAGSWSYLGTVCKSISQSEPTMNFGWLTATSSTKTVRSVVLHEFGHAIGLIHEHQNPQEGIRWNKAAVKADLSGPPNNWSAAKIESNMFKKYKKGEVDATNADPESIMMYPIPASWTENGYFSTDLNTELSETDKAFARDKYPF